MWDLRKKKKNNQVEEEVVNGWWRGRGMMEVRGRGEEAGEGVKGWVFNQCSMQ